LNQRRPNYDLVYNEGYTRSKTWPQRYLFEIVQIAWTLKINV